MVVFTRLRNKDFLCHNFFRSLAVLVFMFMFLVGVCEMWLLVLWYWLQFRWIRLKRAVWIGSSRRPKVRHWEGVKAASRRPFWLTPWAGFHSAVNRRAFERRTFKHGSFVLWSLKLWAFHWWTLEWWHHSHRILVNWMPLHALITRVPRTTTPLQLCDCFMCHLVNWLVQQTIPKRNTQLLVADKCLPQVLCIVKWCDLKFIKTSCLLTKELDIFGPTNTCCTQLLHMELPHLA